MMGLYHRVGRVGPFFIDGFGSPLFSTVLCNVSGYLSQCHML